MKRNVRGNGSFTANRHDISNPLPLPYKDRGLTDNEPRKKRINPPHDQRLRNHHCHIPLHHAHHPFHRRRIRHRVRRRLAPVFGIFQKRAVLVGAGEVRFTGGEGGWGDGGGVGAEVHAAEEAALFAEGLGVELFGGRGEEDGSVVAKDAGEDLRGRFSGVWDMIEHIESDHYNSDGEEDPVAVGRSVDGKWKLGWVIGELTIGLDPGGWSELLDQPSWKCQTQ